MMLRKKHRDVPELNTTSTADISFMLLVFFLVTSSMNSDKGLGRRLPPVDEQHAEQCDVNRSNVLQLKIDDHDVMFCDGKTVTWQELQQEVETFVATRQTDRHIIAVETDRKASYDAYFEMQNAIVAAYRTLRDKMALRQYGHRYSQCTEAEREVIRQRYPQRIAEGVSTAEKGGSR
jgi:biopolymer transport protein ExbD